MSFVSYHGYHEMLSTDSRYLSCIWQLQNIHRQQMQAYNQKITTVTPMVQQHWKPLWNLIPIGISLGIIETLIKSLKPLWKLIHAWWWHPLSSALVGEHTFGSHASPSTSRCQDSGHARADAQRTDLHRLRRGGNDRHCYELVEIKWNIWN